jgi:hypothetical protein
MKRDPIFAPTGVTAPRPEICVNASLRLGRFFAFACVVSFAFATPGLQQPGKTPTAVITGLVPAIPIL